MRALKAVSARTSRGATHIVCSGSLAMSRLWRTRFILLEIKGSRVLTRRASDQSDRGHSIPFLTATQVLKMVFNGSVHPMGNVRGANHRLLNVFFDRSTRDEASRSGADRTSCERNSLSLKERVVAFLNTSTIHHELTTDIHAACAEQHSHHNRYVAPHSTPSHSSHDYKPYNLSIP